MEIYDQNKSFGTQMVNKMRKYMKKTIFTITIAILSLFLLTGCPGLFAPGGLEMGTYEYSEPDNHLYLYIQVKINGSIQIDKNEYSEYSSRIGHWERTGSNSFKITIDDIDYNCEVESSSSFEMEGMMFYRFDDNY